MSEPSRNSTPARWRWLLPAALLVTAVHFSPVGRDFDNALFDFASRHPLREPPVPGRSALVLVDDSTMDVLGDQGERWPFPRTTFAALIAALDRAGAAAILVDLTFFDNSDSAERDLVLATVAAASPRVVLAATAGQGPVFWDDEFRGRNAAWFERPRTGLVEFKPDPDGVARRYTTSGSLATSSNAAETESRHERLLRWHGGLQEISAKGVPVLSAMPFIAVGRGIIERITTAAPDLEPHRLARAFLDEPLLGGPLAEAVRDRVVFVGANASGTFDVKPLPVGGLEPGILIHWTAWTNAIGSGFIRPLPNWSALLGAVAGAAAMLAASRSGRGLSRLVALACALIGVLLSGSYAGLSLPVGWFFPPSTPVLAVGLALLGVVAEQYLAEQARKREIQAMFGAYVDPAVVERLVREPASLRLGGDRRVATVFFSDLAGFTDLSEKLPPEQMVEIVNAYLEVTSECLHRHGAYVDKYIGDAVMAVFGVPGDLPDHAHAACLAALEAQAALEDINSRYAASVGVRLQVRIGLNTGEMVVGNLGSSRKKNYTVMGDTVNLASRLEGANKHFGTAILLGAETASRVADRLAVRPLARLRVKGKARAVEVFTLHGRPSALPENERMFLDHYRAGYAAFCARRFDEAAACLARADAAMPGDQTTLDLRRQAGQLSLDPPPPDWEPMTTLETK